MTWTIIQFLYQDSLAMMVLITYDVETNSAAGRRRLRKVAKECVNYGQRVQNSVFECLLEPVLFIELKHKLERIIDKEKDSIRFYSLGNKWRGKIEHIGKQTAIDMEGALII